MSRYHSPYASYERRSSRWPWLFALLIVIAAAGAALVLVGGGAADRLLDVAGLSDEAPTSTPALAQQAPAAPPRSTATGVPVTETPKPANPTATTPGEAAQAPSGTSAGGALQAAATKQAQPTHVPDPTDDEEGSSSPPASTGADSPLAAAQLWADRWGAGDYDGVFELFTADAVETAAKEAYRDQHNDDETGYDKVSAAERRRLAHDYIVARYEGIRDVAGLTAVKVTVTGQPNLDTQVPIHVEMESSKVGSYAEDNVVQLRKEGDVWKVAWTPSLIFKDLGDGCIDYEVDGVKRGSILDRNGELLAYDATVNIVGVIPGELENEAATIKELAKLLEMSVQDVKDKYADGQPEWFMAIKNYPEPMDEDLINALAPLPGIVVHPGTARIYPLGAAAAHITGYVTKVNADDIAADTTGALANTNVIGRAGIEAAANELLTGKPGASLRVVECNTRAERKVLVQRRPVPPKDLILTIDSAFQKQVDAALGNVRGSAVVLDPRNGAVLALASRPNFDPNWFVEGLTESQAKQVFDEKKTPLFNRALQYAYPTGSVFKVITMSAAMRHLRYTGQSEIDCPQQWSIPNTDTVFRDWTDEYGVGAQGVLTLHNALVQSCNTVFYELGYELDKKDQSLLPDMAKAYGLGAPTDIPYLDEVGGTVPDPQWKLDVLNDYWATGDAVNLAIGQGYLLATPLQMANAYAAIANGGSVLQPFIVEFTRDTDGTEKRVGKRKVLNELPLSEDQIAEIQSALRDQTSNANGVGSARVFGDFDWPIAGKTGTAENQSNKLEKPHSWFAAWGPYGKRATITTIVMVESSGEGIEFAAPRTKAIYEAYLKTDLAKAKT
ncbi:MAG: penicillin-binding protein 2 [Thermomicrobiales bacterium]|nr:penicillin-binding protein 2 [Thermomicrobiales bacterium]